MGPPGASGAISHPGAGASYAGSVFPGPGISTWGSPGGCGLSACLPASGGFQEHVWRELRVSSFSHLCVFLV